MKKSVLAAAFLAAASSSAFAADVVYEEPPAPYVPPVATIYDWSGVYLGVQGGYVWTNVSGPAGFDEDFNGGTIGAHVGANWQHGNIVFGLEGDINYNWNEDDVVIAGTAAEVGTDWSGSVRARLGYAMDRTLLYATGGLALANGFVNVAGGGDQSETLTGWTAGAGVEHAFNDDWTARLEYRYSDYGSDDFGAGLGDFDITEHAVRIGFSYKF
jgi:outer membrane immunogenic protein